MMQFNAQFNAGLTGDAAALARGHDEALARLPATIQAFILVELRKWPTLFAPEQKYQRALLEHLSGLPSADLQQSVAGIARVEAESGCDRILRDDPARFQVEAQALLRKQKLVQAWRREVDAFFQQINPALEPQLYPADAPRRLVVQVYGSGIAIDRNKLWSRFTGTGVRVPLQLEGTQESAAFLAALFGARSETRPGPALLASMYASGQLTPLDTWMVESHQALHDVCRAGSGPESSSIAVTGLSYDLLREYREELMRALYGKVLTGVESPQAFAAYARSLKVAPSPAALLYSADILQAFVRDVFLTGNGTLFVNNTFVEWAAVQALRRAQPRMLVTRFGVRHKFRPFSSMLLFSQPRASDQSPLIEDPAGSFVDVEQLSYYVWLNAEKGLAYRNRTLYLFLAEGVDELLAIRSDVAGKEERAPQSATLADVCATMAQWLGVPLRDLPGRPIQSLIG
jgi:hypothetical protein